MKHNPIGVPGTPHTATAVEILREFECDRSGCVCHESARAGHGLTHCPAHDDQNPSCNVNAGDKGRPVLHCHAGCAQKDLLVSLRNAGLWNEPMEPKAGPGRQARRIPDRSKPELVATYDYTDADGKLLYQSMRYRFIEDGRECKTFRVRRPGPVRDTWVWSLSKDLPRVLYRLPELREAMARERPYFIFYTEGEKNANDIWERGRPATTHLGGALRLSDSDGKWRGDYAAELVGAHVVVLEDNDKAGRAHAKAVASRLLKACASVRILSLPDLPQKGDVSDWFEAGHTIRELVAEAHKAKILQPDTVFEEEEEKKAAPAAVVVSENGRPSPVCVSARELQRMEFPPVEWAVAGIVPPGTTLLAGKPKVGKSFLALSLAVSVSTGALALGKIPVQQGPVLYLDIDSKSEELAQARLRDLLGADPWPEDLVFNWGWPRFGEHGGQIDLDDWMTDHNGCRLVVVDTLQKIRPLARPHNNEYAEDTAAMEILQESAQKHNVAMLLVHHARKTVSSDDVFDEVLNGTGLTAGAAATLLLKRERGALDAVLHRSGRRFKEVEPWALEHDSETGAWSLLGDAKDYTMTKERMEVKQILESEPRGWQPKEVALRLGKSATSVQYLLGKMFDDGIVFYAAGKYSIPKP